MIRIKRGLEPAELAHVRAEKLPILRVLGRPPSSADIDGYRIVAAYLWRAQKHKCCYCEHKVKLSFNDVEHFRPKARADRRPGCADQHGYWWLAYTWSNLLYACPSCNRSGKNDRFPVASGSVSLVPEQEVPGNETPLLIDPAGERNPLEMISFTLAPLVRGGPEHWRARPRDGSLIATLTIEVLKLNSQELLELRTDHVRCHVEPLADDLSSAIRLGKRGQLERTLMRAQRMLTADNAYVGVTYDALRTLVPNTSLLVAGFAAWPEPKDVGN